MNSISIPHSTTNITDDIVGRDMGYFKYTQTNIPQKLISLTVNVILYNVINKRRLSTK